MSAVFSPCRTWRYTLTRETGAAWNLPTGISVTWPKRTVLFVCLNPSTADETQDDPTVRRFALRSTDPAALYRHPDPVGDPRNSEHIAEQASMLDVEMIVAAWGNHGVLGERGDRVREVLSRVAQAKVHTLGFTSKGEPRHPLYLRRDTVPGRLWS